MTNQEIFEMLAENECKLFNAWADSDADETTRATLKEAHQAAKKALEAFAAATGCHN